MLYLVLFVADSPLAISGPVNFMNGHQHDPLRLLLPRCHDRLGRGVFGDVALLEAGVTEQIIADWHWPQYLQAFLYILLAVMAPITHGQPKTGTYNGFLTLFILPFGIWILHKGGFW